MADVVIEKGVPLPDQIVGRPATPGGMTETLRKMEPGDSVVVPYAKAKAWLTRAKQLGITIKTLKISNSDARVWRV